MRWRLRDAKQSTETMRRLFLSAFFFALTFNVAVGQDLPVVSAEWLVAHRAEVQVVHVGSTIAPYLEARISGAQHLPFSAVAVSRDGFINILPVQETARAAYQAAGISASRRVVLYGEMNGLAASRAFFALEAFGHPSVSVLDGGLAAWRDAGGSVESGEAPTPEPGDFQPVLRPDLLVDAEYVEEVRGSPQVFLLDARPAAQFSGAEPGDPSIQRPGHIPGAVNLFWQDAVQENGRLRSRENLVAWYAEAGFLPEKRVVAYCRTGVMGSHAYWVGRTLGLSPVLYDPSFTHWSNQTTYPVQTIP